MVSEVCPRGNLFLLLEADRRPALSVGTSSDRYGTGEGMQSYYLTASKSIPLLRVAPYVSLNWSDADEAFNVPFGANCDLGRQITMLVMYDGHSTHLVPSRSWGAWTTSLVLARMESLGLAVAFDF